MSAKQRVKRILDKKPENVKELDYINFALQCSSSSCQFGKIHEYEREKIHKERANLNTFLALPFGAGKTTSLVDCRESISTNDLSFAGIVGTITKDGEFVKGAALQAAGKVLLIDEANRIQKNVKDAMNNLLEQRSFPRNLGFKIKVPIKKSGKFYKILVKDGYLDVSSRFSCIASSMITRVKEFHGAGISDIAWMTRFVLIRFVPDMDYYEKLTKGETIFKIEQNISRIDEFPFPRYLDAHEMFWNKMKTMPQIEYFLKYKYENGAIGRFHQDLCRMAAYISSMNDKPEITLENYEQALRFLPMMVSNYICSNLSEREFKVLEIVSTNPEITQEELSRAIDRDQSTVSRIVAKLKDDCLL